MLPSYHSSLARLVFRNLSLKDQAGRLEASLVEENQIREYLSKLNVGKSVDPNRMHPVLKELENVLVRKFLTILQRSW